MSWVLEIKDKSGRRIHLSKERWSHIQKHPNMSDKIEQIKETLTNPQAITEFEYDPDVDFTSVITKKGKNIFLFQ